MQRSSSTPCPAARSPEQIAAEHGIDLGRELTTGYAARFIRHKAKQIARRAGFSKSDVEDVAQDLVAHVLENLGAFDPALGHFNVFVKTAVGRYTANILRDAQAAKRDRRNTLSLSMVVAEDERGPVELGDTIGERDIDLRLERQTRDSHETLELTMDVADVLAQLPADLRDLAERLKSATVSEIARESGVPRTTIYYRIKKLQKHFSEVGLRDYLQLSFDTSSANRVVGQ